MQPLVEFRGVSRRFGSTVAVDALDLSIWPGEFFALLGPSGCGKTTLMRMLAGFEEPDAGKILLEGADLAGVPPHRRATNMMFQSYALFPHMDVGENIAFGLRQEGMSRADCAARVAEVLELVRLGDLARRRPDQLSGGQRQRVALARAIAKRPKVLLLDEPLGALDRKLREATQIELKELQSRLGIAFFMVTHDQDEAMVMADRIAVMNRGRIEQCATPAEIYEAPANRFVAEFVGDINILTGTVTHSAAGLATVCVPGCAVAVFEVACAAPTGATVSVAIRPEKIRLSGLELPPSVNSLAGEVQSIGYFGDRTMLRVRVASAQPPFRVVLSHRDAGEATPLAIGTRVWLSWQASAASLLSD